MFVQQLWPHLPCIADLAGCDQVGPVLLPVALQKAAFLYVQSPPLSPGLTPAYCGQYKVLVPGQKYFVVKIGSKLLAMSVDNIKLHLGLAPVMAAPGPRRGHPPKPGGR